MGVLDAIGGIADDLLGKWGADDSAKKAAQRQYAKEKEFAQNAILWRVEDANRAGIHPLYALGNPGISAGGSPGGGVSNYGQNISRAIDAARTRSERNAAQAEEATDRALSRDRTRAEIELLKQQSLSEQARRQDWQRGPPVPDIKGPNKFEAIGGYEPTASNTVVPSAHQVGRDPGVINTYAYGRDADGGVSILPSADVKNRIEDSPLELLWMWNNLISPEHMPGPPKGPEYKLPVGWIWKFHPGKRKYYPYSTKPGAGQGYYWYQNNVLQKMKGH